MSTSTGGFLNFDQSIGWFKWRQLKPIGVGVGILVLALVFGFVRGELYFGLHTVIGLLALVLGVVLSLIHKGRMLIEWVVVYLRYHLTPRLFVWRNVYGRDHWRRPADAQSLIQVRRTFPADPDMGIPATFQMKDGRLVTLLKVVGTYLLLNGDMDRKLHGWARFLLSSASIRIMYYWRITVKDLDDLMLEAQLMFRRIRPDQEPDEIEEDYMLFLGDLTSQGQVRSEEGYLVIASGKPPGLFSRLWNYINLRWFRKPTLQEKLDPRRRAARKAPSLSTIFEEDLTQPRVELRSLLRITEYALGVAEVGYTKLGERGLVRALRHAWRRPTYLNLQSGEFSPEDDTK